MDYTIIYKLNWWVEVLVLVSSCLFCITGEKIIEFTKRAYSHLILLQHRQEIIR